PGVPHYFLIQNDGLLWEHCPSYLKEHYEEPVWEFVNTSRSRDAEDSITGYLFRMSERIGVYPVKQLLNSIMAACPERREFVEIASTMIGT
ncbi:MAG: hypothetical protein J7497_17565, partial [Chitinophagaceae bacterium]|nr:hypothetical protein [Chitinophagaceae bacterium]